MDSTAEALAAVPLFRDLDPEALERIARVARPVVFPEGFEVVKEGDDGLGFFLVQEGELEVSREGRELARVGPGKWFGEMSLLDERPRSATVRAVQETRCLAFYRWDFIPEVRKSPDLALALLAGLSKLVRELDARLAGA